MYEAKEQPVFLLLQYNYNQDRRHFHDTQEQQTTQEHQIKRLEWHYERQQPIKDKNLFDGKDAAKQTKESVQQT